MLHFEGDRDFTQPLGDLWKKLSDAGFLVTCVPDVETVMQSEPTLAVCRLRPGFAFVRGTLDLTLHVIEAVPDKVVRLQCGTKGIGTKSTVKVSLAFAAHDGGTRVHWVADVTELGGLLKAVPQGLLKGAAQKVINDAWNALAAKVQ